MATRPTQTPAWATSGTKTDPGATKQDQGFAFEEAPGHDVVNWLLNLIGLWVIYFADIGYVQWDDLQDLIDNTAIGRVATLLPAANAPQWFPTMVLEESDLGGAGYHAVSVATDGVQLFVATAASGGETYLRAFDVESDTQNWVVAAGVAETTLFMIYNGRHVLWGVTGSGDAVRVYDPSDGNLLNTVSVSNLVDGCSDGTYLNILTTTNLISKYNYWDNGTIADLFDVAHSVTPGCVACNGQYIYIGGASGSNLKVYPANGASSATTNVKNNGAGTPAITKIVVDDEYAWCSLDDNTCVQFPATIPLSSVVGAYPYNYAPGTNAHDVELSGGLSITNVFGEAPALGMGYVVSIVNGGDKSIRISPAGLGQQYLTPSFYMNGSTDYLDACVGPQWIAYCCDENSDGESVVVRTLPQKARTLTRVDPTADRYRAPMWLDVKEG